MREAAAGGDVAFARHIREGHVDQYLRDLEYVEGWEQRCGAPVTEPH